MYLSSIPGSPRNAGPTSPRRSQAVDPGSTTSPRSAPIRLTPRSPDSHPELNAALRMFDFYDIDRQFDSMKNEVQSASKAGQSSALPGIVGDLQHSIRNSVLDAEKSFKCGAADECRLHLAAAKSNQVALLGKIDDIPDAAIPVEKRTALRATCTALGKSLTRMLLQATTKAAVERERRRSARDDDDQESPPSSPTTRDQAPKLSGNTPTRESKKRAHGGSDSPVLAETSPKRQKRSAISSASPAPTTASTTATTTTTTTAGGLSSPPQYRSVPVQEIAQVIPPHGRDGLAMNGDNVAPGSPTPNSSPRKLRALSPQPKPRPRSQLFIAPPDFSSQGSDYLSPQKPATAPPALQPGMARTSAAGASAANRDGSEEQQ